MGAGAWDQAATALVSTAAMWGAKPMSPAQLNPFRRREKTTAQKEREAKVGFMFLGEGLRQLGG